MPDAAATAAGGCAWMAYAEHMGEPGARAGEVAPGHRERYRHDIAHMELTMRTSWLPALCLTILAAGCSSSGDRRNDSSAGAVDTSHSATANATGPTGVLRSVAGTWDMMARPTS